MVRSPREILTGSRADRQPKTYPFGWAAGSVDANDPTPDRGGHSSGPRRGAEFFEHVLEVELYGILRQIEMSPDRLIGASQAKLAEHREFSRRKPPFAVRKCRSEGLTNAPAMASKRLGQRLPAADAKRGTEDRFNIHRNPGEDSRYVFSTRICQRPADRFSAAGSVSPFAKGDGDHGVDPRGVEQALLRVALAPQWSKQTQRLGGSVEAQMQLRDRQSERGPKSPVERGIGRTQAFGKMMILQMLLGTAEVAGGDEGFESPRLNKLAQLGQLAIAGDFLGAIENLGGRRPGISRQSKPERGAVGDAQNIEPAVMGVDSIEGGPDPRPRFVALIAPIEKMTK